MPKRRVLVVFHTVEGQSARIATAVATELVARGVEADVWDAAHAPAPAGYPGVVVGDSIHAHHHSRELRAYVRRHREELGRRPLGLFQVSLMSANDDAAHTAGARQMVDDFEAEVEVHPDVVGLLAGRLAYTQYGWLKRRLMRGIARREGGATDMTRDHEYTNWEVVRQFADDFARVVTERTVLS